MCFFPLPRRAVSEQTVDGGMGTVKRTRLLIADDHALFAAGLRGLLETDFDVVGAVEDGRALLSVAESLLPDIVLLDITMPLLNGLEAARQLRRNLPEIKLIFVTRHDDNVYVNQAFAAGASGYVLKHCAAAELMNAIRQVMRGRNYVTPRLSGCTLHAKPVNVAVVLTERQREVLQLVAEGRSTKEIASVLNVTVKTVEFHRSAIARKLGLRSTAQLTRYALDRGMVA